MTNNDIFTEVANACLPVLVAYTKSQTASADSNTFPLDPDYLHLERIELKKFWQIMRLLKADGMLGPMLRLELTRLHEAIDDTPRFLKLLELLAVTLYAFNSPDAVAAAEVCISHINL